MPTEAPPMEPPYEPPVAVGNDWRFDDISMN